MAIKIYLGNPPTNIKKWIEKEAERKYQEILKTPLTFTAEEANSTIQMTKFGSAPTVSLETSRTGEDGSWSEYIVGTTPEIKLENIGDKVYFRAKQDNISFSNVDQGNNNHFVMTGKIAASGNINTLLKADGSILDLTADDIDRRSCFQCMFKDCKSLISAPELPATTLADNCYAFMFQGCTSLTQAPELKATKLTSCCYSDMFYDCTSLIKAPELKATTLNTACYYEMFTNCYNLTQAPSILPATTLPDFCYYHMFKNCTSLTQAPSIRPATTLNVACYSNMFQNCKSPFTFPDNTFDEVDSLIKEYQLIGDYWYYYDEENNMITINQIEIIFSDKVMIATFDENEWIWTLDEKII